MDLNTFTATQMLLNTPNNNNASTRKRNNFDSDSVSNNHSWIPKGYSQESETTLCKGCGAVIDDNPCEFCGTAIERKQVSSMFYGGQVDTITLDVSSDKKSYEDISISNHHIIPYKVSIYLGNLLIGGDNGDGTLTFEGMNKKTNNTVDYEQGIISMFFKKRTNHKVKIVYTFDSDSEPIPPKIRKGI